MRPSLFNFCCESNPCVYNSVGEKVMSHLSLRSARHQVFVISCCPCESLCICSYCSEPYTAVYLVDSWQYLKGLDVKSFLRFSRHNIPNSASFSSVLTPFWPKIRLTTRLITYYNCFYISSCPGWPSRNSKF